MTVILRSEGNHPGEDQDANGEFPAETGECGQLKWDDYVRLLGGNEGPRAGWLTETVSVIFGKLFISELWPAYALGPSCRLSIAYCTRCA